eukprot:TRINITY_DN30545_c0_g1_i2.p4 TRINITY_DN30545_c0_g1~~TRINITY_DN30545_c0_g1_i2.p4  ORF type:complete len:112 (-),score=13.73 TRINITY_DN30545_c0_g1_i2:603-938(-)
MKIYTDGRDFFFFSSRRRHTRSCLVSWARRCVQETDQGFIITVKSPGLPMQPPLDEGAIGVMEKITLAGFPSVRTKVRSINSFPFLSNFAGLPSTTFAVQMNSLSFTLETG